MSSARARCRPGSSPSTWWTRRWSTPELACRYRLGHETKESRVVLDLKRWMWAGELFRHNLPIELASMIGVVGEDDDAVSTARAADNEVGGVGIESPLPAEA